jgi:hypothetical protein
MFIAQSKGEDRIRPRARDQKQISEIFPLQAPAHNVSQGDMPLNKRKALPVGASRKRQIVVSILKIAGCLVRHRRHANPRRRPNFAERADCQENCEFRNAEIGIRNDGGRAVCR